jgi:proteasome lid subunit RPN8/RPN11
LIIRLHRGQLNWFRRKARRESPKEILAYLIGQRITPQLIAVSYFVYPQLSVSTPTRLEVDAGAVREIRDEAQERGFSILGDIHSHTPPSPRPILSKRDHLDQRSNGDLVTGVCALREHGRPETAFWVADSSLPCKVEYFE